MRVLLTNNTLACRAGSELYTLDLARALLRRGHQPLVFSTALGVVAEELRAATIPVVSDLASVAEAPDIIHGQHHLETMTALLHFPGVPGLFVCHGWLPWEETPPRFPRLRRYVAVDDICRERLVSEAGIPPAQVDVILNFVDLARFRPRAPLPPKPRRALIFANAASESLAVPTIRRACDRLGIAVDVAGISSGHVLDRPEDALPGYDLVFAKARSALEALAVGAAVVLCESHRLGPMVTTGDFARLRRLNFGLRCLDRALDAGKLEVEIARYDPRDAEAVSGRVRAEAGLEPAVDQLLDVYERVRAEARRAPAIPPEDEARAAAAYLRWLTPQVKTGHLLRDRNRHADQAWSLERELEAMRRTRSWRLRETLLAWPRLRRLYRSVRGLPR